MNLHIANKSCDTEHDHFVVCSIENLYFSQMSFMFY